MNMEDMNKAFKEMQLKAQKYDNAAERYREVCQQILAISKELSQLAQHLNPTVIVQTPDYGRKKQAFKQATEDILNALKVGSTVTIETLKKMLPEMQEHQRRYLFNEIRKKSIIAETKEKGKVKIFMKKDY